MIVANAAPVTPQPNIRIITGSSTIFIIVPRRFPTIDSLAAPTPHKILAKAEENEAKAVERYNEGKVSVVEVIDAQTYRQTSQVNYVQAKAAAQGHYSELIKALHGYDYR